MLNKNLIKILFIIGFLFMASLYANYPPEGYLRLKGIIELDSISYKVKDNWCVDKGSLSYYFAKQPGKENKWKSFFGQKATLNLSASPFDTLNTLIEIEGIGNYASRLYTPVNEEHRLHNNKDNLFVKKAEVIYKYDIGEIRYFRGISHSSWEKYGDLFNLYPQQYDIENYLRITGKALPEAIEFSLSTYHIGDFAFIYGTDIFRENKDSFYIRFTSQFKALDYGFFYRQEKTRWTENGELLRSFEASIKGEAGYFIPFEVGLLYQPFRIHWGYDYVEEETQDTSQTLYNSKYVLHHKWVKERDGLGVTCRIKPKGLIIDRLVISLSYLGLVAGNKREIKCEVGHKVLDDFGIDTSISYREPIIGPLPYLYEGTEENPGPIITLPRGKNSPFWVTNANRKATTFNLYLTYDPTPATWFFKYRPFILEPWNLNSQENAPLSCVFGYTLSYFPTTTDRWYYFNSENTLLWEGDYDPTYPEWEFRPTGKWALKRPVHKINLGAKITSGKKSLSMLIEAGQSLATGALAYTEKEEREKSITNLFKIQTILKYPTFEVMVGFGSHVWGEEEWQRRFGQSIDELYKASIYYNFNKYSKCGIEYVGIRETDNKYLAREIGPFDEIRLFYTLRFGTRLSLMD